MPDSPAAAAAWERSSRQARHVAAEGLKLLIFALAGQVLVF